MVTEDKTIKFKREDIPLTLGKPSAVGKCEKTGRNWKRTAPLPRQPLAR